MNWKRATRLSAWGSAEPSVWGIRLVSSINRVLHPLRGLGPLLVLLLALPASLQAAESPPDPTALQRAKQHYLKGEAYFKARDFSAAMGEYQSGYEEKADPVFIFNIAQCQRLLGHPAPALESYRRYLSEAPEGAGRAIAERQIEELERLTAGATTTPPAVPPPATTSVAGAPPASSPAAGGSEAPPAVDALPPPPHAAAPTPLVPPPHAVAPSRPPTATTRSLAAVDNSSRSAAPAPALSLHRDEDPGPPLYRRRWFWVVVGAFTFASIVAVAVASSSGRPACDAGRVCQ